MKVKMNETFDEIMKEIIQRIKTPDDKTITMIHRGTQIKLDNAPRKLEMVENDIIVYQTTDVKIAEEIQKTMDKYYRFLGIIIVSYAKSNNLIINLEDYEKFKTSFYGTYDKNFEKIDGMPKLRNRGSRSTPCRCRCR